MMSVKKARERGLRFFFFSFFLFLFVGSERSVEELRIVMNGIDIYSHSFMWMICDEFETHDFK
jgi:hypothetical protein